MARRDRREALSGKRALFGRFGMRKSEIVIVLLGVALLAVSGCRPKPTAGASCRLADPLLCAGPDRALVCRSGAWLEVPCRGAGGCAAGGHADECDDTLAVLGEACPAAPAIDYACTTDGRRALVCKDGLFGLWRNCRGQEGCVIVGGRHLNCDTTLGQPGDPCEARGTYSCSTNQEEMLICDGTSLAAASSCRGPEGCHFDRESHKIDCDDAVAFEGDPCDRPSRITCGADGKSELVCESARSIYAKKRDCRRAPCRIEHAELFCD